MSQPSITEITVDFDMETGCRALLVQLHNAYFSLLAGGTRVKVRHMDRWVEYEPGKAVALAQLINQIHAQCDDTDGLPSLQPGRRVKRGKPTGVTIT